MLYTVVVVDVRCDALFVPYRVALGGVCPPPARAARNIENIFLTRMNVLCSDFERLNPNSSKHSASSSSDILPENHSS